MAAAAAPSPLPRMRPTAGLWGHWAAIVAQAAVIFSYWSSMCAFVSAITTVGSCPSGNLAMTEELPKIGVLPQ